MMLGTLSGMATRLASQCDCEAFDASTAYGLECRMFRCNGACIVAVVPELYRFLRSVAGDLRSFCSSLSYHYLDRPDSMSLMATVTGAGGHRMHCNSVSVDL